MIQARAAMPRDAAMLLCWRNDPLTRAWSRRSHVISEDEHTVWLAGVFADPTRDLMIVEDRRTPIGTYRLDGVGGERIEVSLTVAPESRGRGYATPIILLASQQAFRHGARVVVADVSVGHIASRRAFVQAGYHTDITRALAGLTCYEATPFDVTRALSRWRRQEQRA